MLGRQEWLNLGKPIDVIHNINRTWRESHCVISIGPGRHLTKFIAYLFMTKKISFSKLGIKGILLAWQRAFMRNPGLTSHSALKEGEPFRRSKMKQGWPPSSSLLGILLEVLARAIWQEKKNCHPNFQGKVNYVQVQVTWFYRERDPKGYVTNLVELPWNSQVAESEVSTQTPLCFHTPLRHITEGISYGFPLKMATKIILTHMHTHLTQTQTQGLYARDTDLCHQLLGIKAKKICIYWKLKETLPREIKDD